ncbi:hypothetical protein N0V84_012671, partial [Fusarium piperis]
NTKSKLNGLKAKIWDFNQPAALTKWNKKYPGTGKNTAQHAFEQLTLVEQVFGYLTKPGVNKKLVAASTDVDDFLEDFESLYRKQYPKTPVLDLSELWTTFMRSLTKEMKAWTKRWLKYRADEMVKVWKAEAVKRLEAVGAARTPETAARALSYQKEALNIMEKAIEHQLIHAYQVDEFDEDDVFQ